MDHSRAPETAQKQWIGPEEFAVNTKFSSRCFVAWYSADGVFQHVSMLPGAHNRGYLATINGRLLLALNGLTATIVGPIQPSQLPSLVSL